MSKKQVAIDTGTAVVLGGLAYLFLRDSGAVEPPPGSKRPPCGNKGDVDGDGWVSPNDITLVQNALLSIVTLTPAQAERADLRGDGSLDMGLVTMLERYIAGIDTTFPACGISAPPPTGAPRFSVGDRVRTGGVVYTVVTRGIVDASGIEHYVLYNAETGASLTLPVSVVDADATGFTLAQGHRRFGRLR